MVIDLACVGVEMGPSTRPDGRPPMEGTVHRYIGCPARLFADEFET